MNLEQIETRDDFIYFGHHHLRRASQPGGVWEFDYRRGLVEIELYLRSLWRLIIVRPPLTWKLMASLLQQAFVTEPVDYDPAWAEYLHPPVLPEPEPVTLLGIEISEALLESLFPGHIRRQQRERMRLLQQASGDLTTETILNQMADLHRMRETWLRDPASRAKIGSHIVSAWVNPTLNAFLGQGLDYLNAMRLESSQQCKWDMLGLLLWAGQRYE